MKLWDGMVVAFALMCFVRVGFAAPVQPLELRFIESTQALSLETVRKFGSDRWAALPSNELNAGFNQNEFWIHLSHHHFEQPADSILAIKYPLLDFLDVYFYAEDRLIESYQVGDRRDYSERPIRDRNFLFPLPSEGKLPLDIYIRVQTEGSVNVPIEKANFVSYLQQDVKKQVLIYVALGIALIMAIFNLFIYVTVRDKAYLYYTGMVACLSASVAGLSGTTPMLIGVLSPSIVNTLLPMSVGLCAMFAALFGNTFISVMAYNQTLYKMIRLFAAMGLTVAVSAIVLPYTMAMYLAVSVIILGCPALAITGTYVWHKGNAAARYYVIGWFCLLMGSVLIATQRVGLLDLTLDVDSTLLVGVIIEVTVLSIALADRINGLKREKLDAQNLALAQEKSLRQIQEGINADLETKVSERTELLAQRTDELRELNVSLEAKVDERTKELNAAFNKLAEQHQKLKEVKLQLVQHEKMSALGTLVSGISHEMNNPINFAYHGIQQLESQLTEFATYLHTLVDEDSRDVLVSFDSRFDAFNRELTIANEGIGRVANLIKDLQLFYKQDDGGLKPSTVVDGIKSTLSLVSSKHRHAIQFKTNFDSDATINANISRLNQVFMNLLVNACDAINEKQILSKQMGTVLVTTSQAENTLEITVEDDGIGIQEFDVARIFDPFYSTKRNNNGTGLGLAISYEIISAHQGKLTCSSVYGKGTEFKISLPIMVEQAC